MEASPFKVVRVSWAEGYHYTFLHYHYHFGEIVQWCVGVMRNGERLQQCSTKPFVYRVPPKEIQGSGHSFGKDQPEATNGSHRGFGLSLVMDSQLEVTKIMVIVRKCGN